MSDTPEIKEDSADMAYVSKATFTHLWDLFKQNEAALAQADLACATYAGNVLRIGDECRDYATQVTSLKGELARVMEDLHTANDALASLRSDHKWLMACHRVHTASTAEQMTKLANIQTRILLQHPGFLSLHKDFAQLNDIINEMTEGMSNGK